MQTQQLNIGKVIINLIGFLLFGMFAKLQLNDVSQYGTAQWLTYAWIIGYTALALLCFSNIARLIPSRIFLAVSFLTFSLAVFRATQIDFNQPLFCFIAPEEFAKRNPAGNETGGLLIMTLWLLLTWLINRRIEHKITHTPC